jgi:hypothetical protein
MVVLVKARTCQGCRALEHQQYTSKCNLKGFKCSMYGIPEQPCPKPKTIDAYFNVYHEIMFGAPTKP